MGKSYSRYTFSPIVNSIAFLKIGPSKQKVWNSPFSRHGWTVSGKLSIKLLSIIVPAKWSLKYLEFAQTIMVLKPKSKNSLRSSYVSCFRIGKIACKFCFSSCCSR